MRGASRFLFQLAGFALGAGLTFAVAQDAPPKEEVELQSDGGTFQVPVLINGAIRIGFTIDSGASVVSVPADVALTLVRTGTVTKSDFIGTQNFVLADGSTMPSPLFRIRTLRVGNIELHDVEASITDVKGGPLLGQSFLSRLGSWSIDNQRHVLIMFGRSGRAQSTPAFQTSATPSPVLNPTAPRAEPARIAAQPAEETTDDPALAPRSALWDSRTHDACIPTAMRNGAPVATAESYCKCMVRSLGELPVRLKLSLMPASPAFIEAAGKCNLEALAPARRGSIFDYGHMPDGKVIVEGRMIEITVHTSRDTLLVRPTLAESWSIADSPNSWPVALYREAAGKFVQPLGCSVESIRVVLKPNYEAAFYCPPGVALHERVVEQRPALVRGEPLHP